MKKLGGILIGLLGAGLAIGGTVAAIKSGKKDEDYVEATGDYVEYEEVECSDDTNSEE